MKFKKHFQKCLSLVLASCMVLTMIPVTVSAAEETGSVYLTDLDYESASVGWEPVNGPYGPLIDTSYYGKIALYLDDSGTRTQFDKGLVCHAASEVVYNLEGMGAVGFQSYVGVTDDGGSCGFYVYTDADDSPLASYSCIYGSDKAQFIDVEIPTDATKLILKTDGGGNGVTNDHSAWADAKLILGGQADAVTLETSALTLEKYETAKLTATATKDGEVVPAAITWSSSDESVVTVTNGTLEAVGMGNATITASVINASGEKATATCEITVINCLYTLAEDWEIVNGDDQQTWSIIDENTVELLVQYGDMYYTGGAPRNTVKNLFLHEVESADFEVSVKMDFKPDENFESAGLLIYGGNAANFALTRRYHTYFETRVLGTHGVNTNSFPETHQSDPSLTQAPIWLKIVKEGTSLNCYYSLDNENWVQHADTIDWTSFSGLGAEDLKVGMYIGDSSSNNDNYATFSDFTIKYEGQEAVTYPYATMNELPMDNQAITNVVALIDAIGTVTVDSNDAIVAAREAYEALNSAEKLEVSNISVLEEAEFEYIWLTLDIGELSPFEGSALDLPVELEDGSKIYWETSDSAHVTENGIVHRDTENDVTVTLTATMITPDGKTAQREFQVELLADPNAVEEEYVSILQIGDSNTEFGNMTQNMKDILNENHGDYGTGFMSLNISSFFGLKKPKNYSFAYAGSWTEHDTATGQLGSSLDAEEGLNGLYVVGQTDSTMLINFLGSEVDLYYKDLADGGSYTVIIDGVEVETINTQVDGDNLIDKASFDAGKYGKHQMIIYVNEGPVEFHGIDVLIGERENRTIINTWGNGAARTEDYARFNEEIFISGLKAVNPDKVVLALGTNDHGVGDFNGNPTPAADFEEYLVTVIERVQKALPDAEIWVMSTFDVSDSGSRQVSRDMLHEYWRTSFPNAVARTGVNYWDMGDWFGEWDGIKMQDSCHCNGEYGRYMMEELYNQLFGHPMTTEELAEVIDSLVVTNNSQVAEIEDLIARYEALNADGKAVVGEERLQKLNQALKVANKLANEDAYVMVEDLSANGYDVVLSNEENAGLAIAGGQTALKGWFQMEQEGAQELFSAALSGSDTSYTVSASIYVDSALIKDPDQYHMIFSIGDRGAAMRVEKTSSGLQLGTFVHTGSGWTAVQSGLLTEDQLDTWIDVAAIYNGAANTLTLVTDGDSRNVTVSNIATTEYTLGIGCCPEKFQRTSDVLMSDVHIYNRALSTTELANETLDDSVLLWYDFGTYTSVGTEDDTPAPVFEIVTQPTDVSVEKGADATVTVVATGEGLTYTWYYKNPGNKKFYVSGNQFVSADGATYTIPMYAWRDGQEVYCEITDVNGVTLKTNTVTLSMVKPDIEITKQPESVTAAIGEEAVVTVEAVGEGLTYTWYYKNPGNVKFYLSGDQFVSEDGKTYTIPMYGWRDGQQVYCVITNAAGDTVQTNTVTLTMQE